MSASTPIDGRFKFGATAANELGSSNECAPLVTRRPRLGVCAMTLLPALVLGGMVLAWQPDAAQAAGGSPAGVDGVRGSLPIEVSAPEKSNRIVVAASAGRLLKNGTRARSSGADNDASKSNSPAKASDAAAGDQSGPVTKSDSATAAGALQPAVQEAKPANPSHVTTAPVEPAPTGATSTGCFAGCLTPDRASPVNRTTAAARAPARSTGPVKVETAAAGTQGGATCVAGCYGSGMQTVVDLPAAATAPAAMLPTQGKAATSISVLRGVTRKRVYGAGQ